MRSSTSARRHPRHNRESMKTWRNCRPGSNTPSARKSRKFAHNRLRLTSMKLERSARVSACSVASRGVAATTMCGRNNWLI